jgi:hypothetical protein
VSLCRASHFRTDCAMPAIECDDPSLDVRYREK